MTEDEVRAAAERLVQFHDRFAPLFGKEEAQDHAYTSVTGLMICLERQSIEPIALNVGDGLVSALQKFLNCAPWDYEDAQAEAQGVFVDELVPTAADSSIGVVGVVDESAFTNKGDRSAGVARQHIGRLGTVDNCQVGVFLVGVTPGGTALLDQRRSLPEAGCEDTTAGNARRDKAHIPEGVVSQTTPQIAAGLIRQTVALGIVTLDWITADEDSGRNGDFLDELEALEPHYVVEVPVNPTVWTEDPASSIPADGGRGRVPTRPRRAAVASVSETVASLGPEAWQTLGVGQGAKGPLVFEFAAVRVWAVRHGQAGPPIWLLVRRSWEPTPEIKYDVSNAEASTSVGVLALVACTRHRLDKAHPDSTSSLGWSRIRVSDYNPRRRVA